MTLLKEFAAAMMWCGVLCFVLLGGALADSTIGSDPAQRAAWLKQHNDVRAKYDVAPLVWNTAAADVAQAYVNTCPGLKHNTNRGSYGENMCVNSATETDQCVVRWADEVSSWNCKANTCAAQAVCGHFTQIVDDHSTSVGCALVTGCTTGGWNSVAVCNYSPAGNTGQRPFPVGNCTLVSTSPASMAGASPVIIGALASFVAVLGL
eukprot:c1481_g1_i1.p1 GENE.c1481_g1_i1~~c1481_g1_i1.p1  ORF type:complete len:207 (-),score=38.50 c1481_g1_i1:92-712(-)